jgi:hypothetical protein
VPLRFPSRAQGSLRQRALFGKANLCHVDEINGLQLNFLASRIKVEYGLSLWSEVCY